MSYLKDGGDERERQSLIKMMKRELAYVDLDGMAICTDDEGCANMQIDQLAKVADALEDRLMETFNSELVDTIKDLGY